MEDKNELSDIVLEKGDNKSMKAKRILIIAALLIVIFLIILVVMKVINKPTDINNGVKLILPPTPTQKVMETKKEDDLFKQVPITEEEDKKESFENMVKSLKEKEIKKQKSAEAKIVESVTKETKKVEKKVNIEPKKIVKAKKVEVKTKPVSSVGPSVANVGIYIQVGATSRLTPDKKFLAKLASNNYNYKLLPIDVKGTKVTKILIGPFKNTTEARAKLSGVKTSINKDAFIYRVK